MTDPETRRALDYLLTHNPHLAAAVIGHLLNRADLEAIEDTLQFGRQLVEHLGGDFEFVVVPPS